MYTELTIKNQLLLATDMSITFITLLVNSKSIRAE